MRFVTVLKISLFALILSFVALPSQAQTHFCHNRIRDIEWSPDGEQLAVMTSQGAVIYDHDLTLIRSIEAPDFSRSGHYFYRDLVWSPDNQWIILPELYSSQFFNNTVGYHAWVIANTETGQIQAMDSPGQIASGHRLVNLIWSPDSTRILALLHDGELGMRVPFSELVIMTGINTETFSPIIQQFDDIYFSDIHWNPDNIISAQYDNITIYLDTNLELLDRAPTIKLARMIPNQDGTLEAGMTPEIFFAVRESGEEEQIIEIDYLLNIEGESASLAQINNIIWLSDDERLIGLYFSENYIEENLGLERLLQGIIVNARTATLDNQFLLEAEADIDGYSVSTRGDRIALYHSETMLELWNPITEERLASIEIAPLTNMDDC